MWEFGPMFPHHLIFLREAKKSRFLDDITWMCLLCFFFFQSIMSVKQNISCNFRFRKLNSYPTVDMTCSFSCSASILWSDDYRITLPWTETIPWSIEAGPIRGQITCLRLFRTFLWELWNWLESTRVTKLELSGAFLAGSRRNDTISAPGYDYHY